MSAVRKWCKIVSWETSPCTLILRLLPSGSAWCLPKCSFIKSNYYLVNVLVFFPNNWKEITKSFTFTDWKCMNLSLINTSTCTLYAVIVKEEDSICLKANIYHEIGLSNKWGEKYRKHTFDYNKKGVLVPLITPLQLITVVRPCLSFLSPDLFKVFFLRIVTHFPSAWAQAPVKVNKLWRQQSRTWQNHCKLTHPWQANICMSVCSCWGICQSSPPMILTHLCPRKYCSSSSPQILNQNINETDIYTVIHIAVSYTVLNNNLCPIVVA